MRRIYSNYGDRCFAAAGPKLWNSLPANLWQADINFQRFRWLLKTFLFGCWDRGTLWLTVKAAPHKFSYLLACLQDDNMVANYLSLVNGKQEIFTAIWHQKDASMTRVCASLVVAAAVVMVTAGPVGGSGRWWACDVIGWSGQSSGRQDVGRQEA